MTFRRNLADTPPSKPQRPSRRRPDQTAAIEPTTALEYGEIKGKSLVRTRRRKNHGPMSISVAPGRSRRKGEWIMAKYVLLLGGADLDKRTGNAELAPKIFEQFSSWLGSLRERGQYVQSHKLRDHTGARLTVRGGQVVEGPFIESKEAVGGVFVIESSSLEEAIATARTCPTLSLQNGFVEVRVLEEVGRPAAP
jgi:hypothetical protein